MGIGAFRHKGLYELYATGKTGKVDARLHRNTLLILDHLAAIVDLKDCMGVKDFHGLKGNRKGTYSMHVSGNYCITFKWNGRDVYDIHLEDYH